MNCHEARILLSAYREISDFQSNELDTHLETCPACRQVLAEQGVVGERLQLLSPLEPPPDAHAKLMRALAAEHTHYLQRSSASATPAIPAPDFLKPYIKEHIQRTAHVSHAIHKTKPIASAADNITALSTAETGPLPVLSTRQRRRKAPMNQFAILGLAAAFLLTMLTGGLVSLLLLASHGLSGPGEKITSSATQQSQVALASYTTQTAYPNVVSAVASEGNIYYSAYGNGQKQWMIARVNSTQKNVTNTTSTQLLSTASTEPLFVLAASHDWLIWLELDAAQAIYEHGLQSQQHVAIEGFSRKWTLYALSLHTNNTSNTPISLTNGTFYTNTAPSWVHTPVQGLAFAQADTLLLATIDAKGNSQLSRYLLDGVNHITSTVIATASNGHILTSPTIDSTGTNIFWSEEWFTSDNVPHGNIWEQQQSSSLIHSEHGWQPLVVTDKHLFLANETSFHPQVINDTLFLLSTAPTNMTNTVPGQGTPNAVGTANKTNAQPTGTAVPAKTTTTATFPVTTRLDPVLYRTQIDEMLSGTLLSIPLDNLTGEPKVMSDGLAAAPQSGTRFLLWQTSSGYQMYDTEAGLLVSVSSLPKNATFLAVNGNMTVWMLNANGNGNSASGTGVNSSMATVTFDWFDWGK